MDVLNVTPVDSLQIPGVNRVAYIINGTTAAWASVSNQWVYRVMIFALNHSSKMAVADRLYPRQTGYKAQRVRFIKAFVPTISLTLFILTF